LPNSITGEWNEPPSYILLDEHSNLDLISSPSSDGSSSDVEDSGDCQVDDIDEDELGQFLEDTFGSSDLDAPIDWEALCA
jgi:hypothetical protein